MTAYATRRAALKGRVLMGASIIISEGANYETFAESAEELGLSEETLDSVLTEVAEELWRRSLRLPTADECLGVKS